MTMNEDEKKLLEVVRNDQKNFEAHQDLGKLYVKLGDRDKAVQYYKKALELNISDGWTHLYIGNVFYAKHQFQDALKWFFEALKLIPEVPAPYWCIANAYEKINDFENADIFYKKAVEVDPDDDQAHRLLAKWLTSKNIK